MTFAEWKKTVPSEKLAKKEVIKLKSEADKPKILRRHQGHEGMPGALFVVDPKKERIAVKEARILGIRSLVLSIQTVTRTTWIM